MPDFSFVILTFNEEDHLPRLLESIKGLKAETFVLDSGSTDNTLNICSIYGAKTRYNQFENHPKQWHAALTAFEFRTAWLICLDADQIVTPELYQQLQQFQDSAYQDIDGIYFNRKNYFKGQWLRFGGYYPKYLLKMFRTGKGFSDLHENMDHRFVVPGRTATWKKGHILEENLKENKISFWIDKHNRYSDLLAHEEIERMNNLRIQTIKPDLMGNPDERTAWLKNLWWRLPRFVRPFFYFTYRMVFQFGILDGRRGILFHFLQGFWFRIIVDVKIEEILKENMAGNFSLKNFWNNPSYRFVATFLGLFSLLYYFNIFYMGITAPGNYYSAFLDQNLDYIRGFRILLISISAAILKFFGYQVFTSDTTLHALNAGGINVVYSCLGFGVMSFFAAFVIAWPEKPVKSKLMFLPAGLLLIQILNVTRFILITLFWRTASFRSSVDHHILFNFILYLILLGSIYFWINHRDNEAAKTENPTTL